MIMKSLISRLIVVVLLCVAIFPYNNGYAEATGENPDEEENDAITYVATSDAYINVLRDPSNKSNIVYQIEPNSPVYVIALGEEWSRVLTDYRSGYVSTSRLNNLQAHTMGVADIKDITYNTQDFLSSIAEVFDSFTKVVASDVTVKEGTSPDVPLFAYADDASFENALLIGDSQASGLLHYGIISPLEITSVTGLCIRDITEGNAVVREKGKGKMTVLNYLKYKNPRVLYLWLGQNDIKNHFADNVLQTYNEALNILIEALPHTLFYLFEMAPLNEKKEGARTSLTSKNVNDFNAGLHVLAEKHNVYVAAIHDLLIDSNGAMPSILVCNDNFHLSKLGHILVADYIRTHTLSLE